VSRNDRQNWLVLIATLILTGVPSVFWIAGAGIDDEHNRAILRYTAQIAFALYLVVLVARPLQQLLRKDWTATLLRNRRLIGVAFVAVMTTHLGLIAYRYGSQSDLEFGLPAVGAGAFAIFYLMLITSFDRPRKALSPKAWMTLHRTGLVIAALIFGLPRSLDDLSDPDYLKFGIPFAIAVLIRFTAWLRSRQQGSLRSSR
jgi:DMSO/TMAO reductase YedYZ heme-binding membrane subunit